jgi:TatA/E family protein of Tat protein translocase
MLIQPFLPIAYSLLPRRRNMFGLGAGEILIILVLAFLLFGPRQLPEVGRQVGKAVKGLKETADDLRKSVEPEVNLIQQEVKMVEQDFEASMKEAEEEVNSVTGQGSAGGEQKTANS